MLLCNVCHATIDLMLILICLANLTIIDYVYNIESSEWNGVLMIFRRHKFNKHLIFSKIISISAIGILLFFCPLSDVFWVYASNVYFSSDAASS